MSRVCLGVLMILAASAPAPAQDWPNRPITVVVSAAAGGPIDVFGRVMAERMGQLLGQRVVIENVPGAGAMLGGQRVARAEPDGYTMLLGTIATHAHSQTLYRKPLYDAVADFTPVALIAELPLVLIARKDLPANSLEEFMSYAKANPGRMNYGSAGAGRPRISAACCWARHSVRAFSMFLTAARARPCRIYKAAGSTSSARSS